VRDGAERGPQGRVQLMTIFRAKGLEWGAVVMLGTCRQDFFGASNAADEDSGSNGRCGGDGTAAAAGAEAAADAELKRAREDARLAYVAMTRARDLLLVSACREGYAPWQPRRGDGREPHQSIKNACRALGVKMDRLGFGTSASSSGAQVIEPPEC
jgi:superfamily I DNA/RNA helicase